MTDSLLNEIYEQMQINGNSGQIYKSSYQKLQTKTEDIEKALMDLISGIGQDNLGEAKRYMSDYGEAQEQYGFECGFKYAVRLMLECGGKD